LGKEHLEQWYEITDPLSIMYDILSLINLTLLTANVILILTHIPYLIHDSHFSSCIEKYIPLLICHHWLSIWPPKLLLNLTFILVFSWHSQPLTCPIKLTPYMIRVWTYGMQHRTTASTSNIDIFEHLQSRVLCMIVDIPWYMTNIQTDLKTLTVKEEICHYSSQYIAHLSAHRTT
jgi:hypothetical protein